MPKKFQQRKTSFTARLQYKFEKTSWAG